MRQLFINIGLFFQNLFAEHHTAVQQVAHLSPTPTSSLIQHADANLTTLPATGPADWMWLLLIVCLVAGLFLYQYTHSQSRG